MSKTRHAVLVASATAALFSYGCYGMLQVWTEWNHLRWQLALKALAYLLSILLAVFGISISRSILRSRYSERASFFSVFVRVAIFSFLKLYAGRYYYRFVAACDHPEKAQRDLLMKIVRDNRRCGYGQQHEFEKIHSVEDFRKMVPLVHSYDVLRPFVDMTMDSVRNVLFRGNPIYYGYTSGTTGRHKVLPISPELVDSFTKFGFYPMSYPLLCQDDPIILGEYLGVRSFPKLTPTRDGLVMGPISVLIKNKMPIVSPPRTSEAGSEANCLYLHALFGLSEPNVVQLDGFMSTLLYSFFLCIEDNWQKICDDIEHGTISIALPSDLKTELQKELVAQPKRANQLRQEFAKGFEDIAKRVWPHLAGVSCVATGSFRVYTDLIEAKHLTGMRIRSSVYASTEGLMGISVDTKAMGGDSKYTPALMSVFYEFLEVNDETAPAENRTVLLHQVKTNIEYEIVVSNASGLYRYRTGDIIMFKEPFRGTFNFEFRYRLGQMLNLQWEKMSESVFYEAIGKFHKQLRPATLSDYMATENGNMEKVAGWSGGNGRFYVTFVEIQPATARIISKDEETFDKIIQELHELYHEMRVASKIQQLRLVQVHPGTFQKFKAYLLGRRALSAGQQFKMPRVIRDQEALEFLLQAKVT